MKKGRPPIKVKRPRQPAVRHKAGPLALLNFVVNKTASFFLYSFRQFSTWKRNWIKDDKRSNPLKIKAFSVCRYYTVTAFFCHTSFRRKCWHPLYSNHARTQFNKCDRNIYTCYYVKTERYSWVKAPP